MFIWGITYSIQLSSCIIISSCLIATKTCSSPGSWNYDANFCIYLSEKWFVCDCVADVLYCSSKGCATNIDSKSTFYLGQNCFEAFVIYMYVGGALNLKLIYWHFTWLRIISSDLWSFSIKFADTFSENLKTCCCLSDSNLQNFVASHLSAYFVGQMVLMV